ncbi:hypothetical protein C8R43DRAFT_1031634 [Mycena crocata]|nr:hypothetical protein C8R43DRAFT_1031634 [Mycena crocata]
MSRKWLHEQRTPLKLETGDLTGQTIIITGANRGLGLEAAKHLSRMNVEVLILACRDVTAGEAAVREVQDAPGRNCKAVSCWQLDLSSFDSVRSFATRFRQERRSLNILVCNAGLMSFEYSQTADGWEKILQVNYISTALLVMLLLPNFTQSPHESRIIMLTSDAHYFIRRVQEADEPQILAKLNDPEHCSKTIGQRYFLSKLFVLFFAKELARRRSKPAPTVVAVNPGYCHTGLDSEFKAYTIKRYMTNVMDHFIARTPEMGSRTVVHAAVDADGPQQDGKYLAHCRLENESEFARSEEGVQFQERLWEETVGLLCKIDTSVEDILKEM